ncbi:MAG: acyltransferase [Lachnospiraceae bacterium]|nr:acyltransferase [Lachnospiraceae bacterium]
MKQNGRISYQDFSAYRSEIMGVSIIGILFCHLAECQLMHGVEVSILAKLLVQGTAFVDVFMIVSGIGLYYSFLGDNNLVRFYKKRLLRLIPTYLVIAFPYWIWRDIIANGLGIDEVLKDIFFYSLIVDGVSRFWFVFAILIFYIIFPLIFAFINVKNRGRNTLIAILCSVIGSMILMYCIPEVYTNLKIMIDRIPAFVLGVYLGKKVYDNSKVRMKELITIILMCLVTQFIARCDGIEFVYSFIRYYTNTILAVILLVVIACVLKLLKCIVLEKTLEWFGSITMELYIFHSLIKNIFDYPTSTIMYVLVAVLLPIPCAYLSHVCINRLLKKRSRHESV